MIGSFFAVLLLFAPAVVLLGMVSPFAIRLAITDVETAGAVAGRFYALSTFGSLLGTFVPALIAIPLVDAADAAPDRGAARALGLVPARPQAARPGRCDRRPRRDPAGAIKSDQGLLEDSLYQFIQVSATTAAGLLLRLNEGVAVHSVWREDTVLTGGVWDAFLALPPLLDRPASLRSSATRAGRPRVRGRVLSRRESTGSSSTLP